MKCIYTLKCGWSTGQRQEGGSLAQGHVSRAGHLAASPQLHLSLWLGLEPVTLRAPNQDPGYQLSLRLYATLTFFLNKMASCARCTQANAQSRGLKADPVIISARLSMSQ